MADRKTYSGLSKKVVVIPAKSVTNVDYMETLPNYFRVQNHGTAAIYCSTANIPTMKSYDFMVSGGGMKMFAEPFNRARLYMYNPTTEPVEVVVLSFNADFDPLALALSDLEIDIPNSVEMNSVISAFGTSLPEGNNTIGKVGFASVLETAIKGMVLRDKVVTKTFTGVSATATYLTPTSGYTISEVVFMSNDSDSEELTITFPNNTTIVLKPGEVLNNIKCWATTITVSGCSTWRTLYNCAPNSAYTGIEV